MFHSSINFLTPLSRWAWEGRWCLRPAVNRREAAGHRKLCQYVKTVWKWEHKVQLPGMESQMWKNMLILACCWTMLLNESSYIAAFCCYIVFFVVLWLVFWRLSWDLLFVDFAVPLTFVGFVALWILLSHCDFCHFLLLCAFCSCVAAFVAKWILLLCSDFLWMLLRCAFCCGVLQLSLNGFCCVLPLCCQVKLVR